MNSHTRIYTSIPYVVALVYICFAPTFLYGQTASSSITGQVFDQGNIPMGFVNVQLLEASDSSFVAGRIADAEGRFVLENIHVGDYLVFISMIGYTDHLAGIRIEPGRDNHDIGTVTLAQSAIQMEEVSVEARRALYEQQSDRIVINVGTSVTLSGSTALQILERSPGVVVDEQNGTISMLGKDGVQLMVNGKLSYLPANALVQYLSSINADNVESIELITTPPSSLDAEGNAGYINIELKRNLNRGLNGSFTLTAGYGKGEQASSSIDASYQQGKTSLFGSYAFSFNGQEQTIENYRRLVDQGNVLEYPTQSIRNPHTRNHNTRLGIDYALSPRVTIGGLVASYNNRWSMDADNNAIYSRNSIPQQSVLSLNDEVNQWRHFMSNANIRFTADNGSSLSFDFDYLRYQNENPTNYNNTIRDLTEQSSLEQNVGSDKRTPLNIYVAKMDYKRTWDNEFELEAGAKTAIARFTNKTTYQGLMQSDLVNIAGLTSQSSLDENVYAVYASTKYKLNAHTSMGIGLRYELTDSNLDSEEEVNLVDREIGELFPTVTLDHQVAEQFKLGASYNRRITRPSFRDLAPFVYFLNPQTFFTGNTSLQPAIINTIKMDASFNAYFASVSYAWEDRTISRFQWVVLPEENVQIFFPDNLKGTNTVTGLLAVPINVTSWWSTQNNLTAIWQRLEGNRNGEPLEIEQSYVRLNTTQTIRLPKEFVLEVSALYQGPSTFGTARMKAFGSMNVGLQRSVPSGRLSFTVNDVFDTMNFEAIDGSPEEAFYNQWNVSFRSRTYAITYTRRLGGKKNGVTRRATAAEEELRRAGQ